MKLYDDSHGEWQAEWIFNTYYIPHVPSSSFIMDVGPERGLFLHVKILRPCPSWKGQRKREVRASRLTSLAILRLFACC